MRARSRHRRVLLFTVQLSLASSCTEDSGLSEAADSGAEDAGGSTGRDECKAFDDLRAFAEANKSCLNDGCSTVGACGGNVEIWAIASSASAEFMRRQALVPYTCFGFDGPIYEASCVEGKCVAQPTGKQCGVAPPADGGFKDAAVDASTYVDAAGDSGGFGDAATVDAATTLDGGIDGSAR